MVDINWTLVAQVVNFLLLLGVVAWFGYKPIMDVIEERQKRIADDLDNAEKLKQEAIKVKRNYDKQFLDAHTESQLVVEKANKAAKEVYDQMLAQARKEQEKMFEDAREQIMREKNNALFEVREEVISLSMLVAGKIIDHKIDAETDQKLINDFLDEVKDKSGDLLC